MMSSGLKAETETMEDAPHLPVYQVGQKVRVLTARGEASHRAVVSYSHGNTEAVQLVGIFRAHNVNTYDVIYDSPQLGEECNIPEFRVMALEEFEVSARPCEEAETMKDRGNVLFAKRDYTEAMKCYQKAMELALGCVRRPLVGSSVLCVASLQQVDYPAGLVSYLEAEHFEVLLPGGEEGKYSEEQLVLLCDDEAGRVLQHSVLKNMCRCCLKRGGRGGWALRYANLALACIRSLLQNYEENSFAHAEDRERVRRMYVDCLYFRAKTLLSLRRPAHALLDAQTLSAYDQKRALEIEREGVKLREERRKGDRRLAREIAKWVGEAMQGPGVGREGVGGVEEGDVELVQEDEEEEGEETKRWKGGETVRTKPASSNNNNSSHNKNNKNHNDKVNADADSAGEGSRLAGKRLGEKHYEESRSSDKHSIIQQSGILSVLFLSLVLVALAMWINSFSGLFLSYYSNNKNDGKEEDNFPTGRM